jgi:hypothetical protein
MGIIRKYAFVLVLALAVIYVYAPVSLGDFSKPQWLDDISVIVNKSLAPAKPEVRVSRVDPIAAANVDEDMDYRIAQRMKSTEGWRSFLAVHPAGAHAQSARAALDKLARGEKPPAPAAAQASNGGSSDTKTPSELASPDRPSQRSEVASDEICKRAAGLALGKWRALLKERGAFHGQAAATVREGICGRSRSVG